MDGYRKLQHDEVDQTHNVSNATTPKNASFFNIGATPLDENLDNPLHGIEPANVVDGDEKTPSRFKTLDRYEWITILPKDKYSCVRNTCTKKFMYLPCTISSKFR